MSNSLRIFAVIFILLASAALLIGESKKPTQDELTLSFAEYDELIQMPVSRIEPLELAELLIKQEHHYNLIDLQGADAMYQIPTAEIQSINSFLLKNIPVNETIIIYSKNETEALQLYYLLLIRGYFKVSLLQGGITQWFNDVLQPRQATISPDKLESRRKISKFFGGAIVGDSTADNSVFKPVQIVLQKQHKKHQGC